MRPNDSVLSELGISFVTAEGGLSEYRLNANNLKIILAPDPTSRVVAVVQHVHVGSRHEGAGNTGYSHLLEHMLFKGTPTHNAALGNSYDDFMRRQGGNYNATTWYDRTNYFAKVPSASLGEYLAYEADRLRNAIITDEDLATEMPVVVDEFDIGENEPEQILDKLLMATMFTEHPYKVDTIGAKSEVLKVTAQALKDRLYDIYYWPNNTSLIIVGGFDETEALRLVVQHYAGIPLSPNPIPPMYTVEPPQFGERRFVINKPGDLPLLAIGFHVPQADHPDTYALNALAQVLGGNKSSRLYRRLVDKGLCSQVGVSAPQLHDAAFFEISAKLTPGTKLQDVERIILSEVERVKARLISKSEMAVIQELNLSGTVIGNADPLRRAQSISEHEACASWLWGERYDAEFAKVTREDVRNVACRYLTQTNRTVGHFVPTETKAAEQPAAGDGSNGSTNPAATPDASRANGGSPNTASYASQVRRTVLPNGLTVLLLPTEKDGAVGVSFACNAGSGFAPADKRVVATMAANLLPEGSKRYSKAKIAKLTGAMLAQLNFRCEPSKTSLTTLVPPAHVAKFLDMLADVVRNPLFDNEELGLLKTKITAEIEETAVDPNRRAMTALSQSFYGPDSPHYRLSTDETAKQVAGITRDDLVAYHGQHYVPQGAFLTVVGKFNADKMVKLIESKFGGWAGNTAVTSSATTAFGQPATRRVNIQIDGKDNLTIVVGVPAEVTTSSPDYLAALVANQALGGDTLNSRLGKEIREKRGLTYGVTCRFFDTACSGAPWLVHMTTNGAKLDQAVPLIGQVVQQFLGEGISERELSMEKEGIANAFAMQLDTAAGVASVITQFQQSGLGVDALDTFAERLAALTKEDVDAAARKYFRVDEALTVVAGNLPR